MKFEILATANIKIFLDCHKVYFIKYRRFGDTCFSIYRVTLDIITSLVRYVCFQRSVDKSLARPTSRYILFDGENISFDASLVIYINSTNIPPIMIINRIYKTQNLLSL